MAKSNASEMLTSLDSLFTTQEQRDEAKRDSVQDIPISQISDFPEHPFKVETLDRDILHTFVERIEIGEKILPEGRKVAGPRTPYRQSIRIFYRFIGEASGDSLRQVQANRDREETVGAAGAF